MKKIAIIPLVFIAILTIGVIWFYTNISPVSTLNTFVNFNVQSGASAAEIGNSLYAQGLVRDPRVFKVYVQFSGISDRIQAGDYRLSPSFNLFQIVDTLSKSPLSIKVTIPEGLRREEIAAKFTKSLDQNASFTAEFLNDSKDLEGYLFPDTYLISNNATPGAIIDKMTANYRLKVDSLTSENNILSDRQKLILASIIEREAGSGDERSVIAGILMNRFNAGIALQVDATVQYAIGTSRCKTGVLNCSWWDNLRTGETDFNSPFNTYLNKGLPPAPIANPGLTALEAAYNPAKTDYLFYIHDSTGQIHYARTLEEQNINIKKYLR